MWFLALLLCLLVGCLPSFAAKSGVKWTPLEERIYIPSDMKEKNSQAHIPGKVTIGKMDPTTTRMFGEMSKADLSVEFKSPKEIQIYLDDQKKWKVLSIAAFKEYLQKKNGVKFIIANTYNNSEKEVEEIKTSLKSLNCDRFLVVTGGAWYVSILYDSLNKIHPFEERARWEADFQSYLEQRWTPERINKFCVPETRHLGVQALYQGGDIREGKLYQEKEKQLGKIEWRCTDYQKDKLSYVIEVDRGDTKFWVLEEGKKNQEPFSSEGFAKHFLYRKLETAFRAYLLVNRFPPENCDEMSGLNMKEALSFSSSSGKSEFRAKLWNNQILSATIGKDMSIENVTVDGKVNDYWNIALRDATKNVDQFYKNAYCPGLDQKVSRCECIVVAKYIGVKNKRSDILKFRWVAPIKGMASYPYMNLPLKTASPADNSILWIVFIEDMVPVNGAFKTYEPGGIINYSRDNLNFVLDELEKLGKQKIDEAARTRIFERIENQF